MLMMYPLLSGDHQPVQSRSVTLAHQLFAQDCKACHNRIWQPALRIIPGNHHRRSVSDKSCRNCHRQRTHDHHPESMIREDVKNCVQCHQEHRGKDTLRRVANPHCARCHQSLTTQSGSPSTNFKSVVSFDKHPEFAARRTELGKVGKFHLLLGRAKFESDAKTGKKSLRDITTLKFNHQLHLDPAGLSVPPGVSASGKDGRQVLNCNSCHEADQSGSYMKPIAYEQHCAKCHQLKISDKFQWLDGKSGRSLPHGDPKIIRGILRDRLSAYADANPDSLRPGARPKIDRSRLPHKRRDPGTPSPAKEDKRSLQHRKWDWIQDQLANIGEDVFQREAVGPKTVGNTNLNSGPSASRLLATSCLHCHEVKRQLATAKAELSWTIAPTKVPSRWYPHSRFSHNRHLMVKCVDCHYKKVPPQGVAASLTESELEQAYAKGTLTSDLLSGTIFASSHSKDILMPSIQTCRTCHGKASRVKKSGQARSDCIECHRYHLRPILKPMTTPMGPDGFPSRNLRHFLED